MLSGLALFRSSAVKEPAARLSRRDMLTAAGLGLLVLLLGYGRMVPQVCGGYHDDAIYVITAKALAQGQGYRLINLPGAPRQTKFPILYPALLALVWKLWPNFPENLLLMKWLSVLCGAAAVGLAYLFLRRFNYFSGGVALAAGLLCATSSFFLYFASQTFSEIPFALLTIPALWAMEAQIRAPSFRRGRQFGSGVLLGLPFLCRIIGVALVPAGLLLLYYWRRPLRWVILGAAVVMVPWILWMLPGLGAWHHDPVTGYYTDYLGWWGSIGPALLAKVAAGNLLFIIWSIPKLSLEGLNQWLAHVALWPILATVLGVICLVAVLGRLSRGQVLPYYLLFFLMVVLLWPWSPFRLLVPVLPFVIAYLLAGILTLFGNLPEKLWFRVLTAGVVSVLVLANLTLLYQDRVLSQRTGIPYDGLPSHPASWTQYQDLFHWLKANTGPGDVLASWEDPMLYLYTGRLAIRTFEATPAPRTLYGETAPSLGTVADLERTLRTYKVRYLVKMPVDVEDKKEVDQLLDGLQQRYPDWVKTVWVGQDRRFAVLALGQEK
ncbi:MAG: ArnT family glycosyltransferase [Desulfobaccales bacterium]